VHDVRKASVVLLKRALVFKFSFHSSWFF
jgi:hypothetical protein